MIYLKSTLDKSIFPLPLCCWLAKSLRMSKVRWAATLFGDLSAQTSSCVCVCETEAVHLQQTEAVILKRTFRGHREAEEAASKGHPLGLDLV